MERGYTPDIDAIRQAVIDAIQETVNSPWLNPRQAAQYVKCTQATLKTWRSRGEGPRYHVLHGKSVRYHVDDLDGFIRGEASTE